MAAGWDAGSGDHPLPPTNGMVASGYKAGVLDVRWDNPALLAGNTTFNVVGVNVYRADSSDRGPFHRINAQPVGSSFYRDRTDLVVITEAVGDTAWITRGDGPNTRRWRFKTRYPIAKSSDEAAHGSPTMANAPSDVTVWIDGVKAEVQEVFGPTGEVTLVNVPGMDGTDQGLFAPTLPGATSSVSIRYHVVRNHVRSGLDAKVWYRLTTVVLDAATPSGMRETPLEYSRPTSVVEVETLDYIWREGIRRNQWILQRGGERVKVFIRKQAGVPCDCRMDPRTREWQKQPSNRCLKCYGCGFLGGYEGPYEAIIGPDDGERRISQGLTGRRMEHSYEVFTGPSPLVTQRDFIVKQTNERYSIGPVRRPSNRGNVLQQHFTIAYLDEGDVRYRVPIDGTSTLTWPQTRTTGLVYGDATARPVDGAVPSPAYPVGPQSTTPMATDKAGWPDEKQPRGRTPTWEIENT